MSHQSLKEQLEDVTLTPFTLVVKGRPEQAQAAAESRGCEVYHVARLVAKGQTLVIVKADESKLRLWFTEEGLAGREGKGWPTGSLLFYSPKENLTRFQEMGIPR